MLTIYKNGLSALFLDILRKCLGGEGLEDKPISEQYDTAYHIGGTFNHFLLWFSRDMADSPETMAKYTLAVLSPSTAEKRKTGKPQKVTSRNLEKPLWI